jgi:hypothetical protein
MSCQLTRIQDIAERNNCLDDLVQFRVRLLRTSKRKLVFYIKSVLSALKLRKRSSGGTLYESQDIQEGDIVRVRPKENIKRELDDAGKYKGCWFIDEQYEYCGKEFKIAKKVNCFFDEAKQKIVKCSNMFFLEGVLCSGRQRLYSVSCDRNCFFFWHTAWLEKVTKIK